MRRIGGVGGIPETYEFRQAQRHIDKTPQNGVYVLIDAHPYLVDPVNVRLIKEIAHEYARTADPQAFDLARLAALTEGYSGAEIEQAVVAALYEAAAKKQPLSSAEIEAETARTRPLSVVMAERVHRLREWARERTVPAN